MNTKFQYTRFTPQGLQPADPITLSTQLILNRAEELGITWETLPGTKIIKMEYQGTVKYFRYQISSETTDIGFYACLDKSVTNNILSQNQISVPKGFNLTRQDPQTYWDEVYNSLAKPVVVKPTYGNQGNAVSLNINDLESYHQAVEKAFAFLNDKDAGVIVEEAFMGKEYRVLATREKIIGILYRMPANVVGDGTHTVAELIEIKNQDPRRGSDDTFALFKINIDDDVKRTLQNQNLSLDFVPTKDQQVFVREVSNIAKGGDSIDVTDIAHPSVIELTHRALLAIPGLDFAGVDFMTQDITQPQTPDSYRIIEINSSPGFCIQELPYLGTPRDGKTAFLKIMFPELQSRLEN